ncbi:hypothetical protein TCSYLVIO_009790 [Trypanosoma cruzi]|nr:hypothetical protein TCSYLVIO_009790 [Trypanosoma cruzi]KAF8289149.1 hypothetical protein TcBrA4_0000700 [Trypanosoma cruzi]PBJ74417.1 hypothetical protein BCY84_12669 [Trypanosoma cruzi cruzi]PWU91080.1 hypothetical protein C4B63_45g231 [Trypanosoma cruzi]RNF16434.1 hypothetical protein TcG_06194 [Trypanosoma cruzi]
MFRGVTGRCSMRVLCLTVVPDGGAMTLALRRLGYMPYTLRSAFQHGRATRHPAEWSRILDGERPVDMRLFNDHDAVIGPPATLIYDRLLRECPEYTKVILVEETDKKRWVQEYEAHVGPLLQDDTDKKYICRCRSRRRVGRSRIAKAFDNMIHKMTPRCEAAGPVAALEDYESQVRSNVDRSRLLVYRYGDGWEPLCAFLEKDLPDEPFPPYDSGVRVIGNLQERIERTEKLTYLLAALACCGMAYVVYPAFGSLQTYVSELYRDYQTAYATK